MAKLKKVTTLNTLDDVNIKLADLKLANAKLDKVQAELNVKRTELENKFTPELTSLRETKLLIESDIELWALDHKDDLTTKRSWDVLHGSFGFRQSTKLGRTRKFSWEDVKDEIKKVGGKFKTFLRIKEEIAKDELKAAILAGDITLDEARSVGVAIETPDNFFIEPNSIDVDNHS